MSSFAVAAAGRGAVFGRAQDGVVRLGEGAVGKQAALVGGEPRDRVVVDRLHDVSLANARAVPFGIGWNAGRAETGSGLNPPDAVSGGAVGRLRRKVEPGEHTGGQGGCGQNHGKYPGLESVLHRLLQV